jgi:benzoate-CoA ligase family protein
VGPTVPGRPPSMAKSPYRSNNIERARIAAVVAGSFAMRPFNMAWRLVDEHVAEGRGDRTALILAGSDTRVSYGELLSHVNRVGNVLRTAGLQPEQRVALLLPDGLRFVSAFIGAMKMGAVPVPLNTLAPAGELLYLLDNSRARALVTTPDHARALLATRHAALGGPTAFDTALVAASDRLDPFPTRVDEPAYWLYSSGTTGRPKAVVHLHGDMLACVEPYAREVLAMTPDDITFSVARSFFSYGLVNSLYLPLLHGAATVLLEDRPIASTVLEVVRRHRPTLLFAVPTAYVQLCDALEASEHSTASLRVAISAGEALPEPVHRRWRRLTGVDLLDGLGSTEVGYIFCSNRRGGNRPGSSGQPVGGHALRIVDESGADVPDGESGELWVRARSSALCYWNEQDQSRNTFVGEWLRTGDRYRRDTDGFYWHLGRLNDVFKVSGQWVAALEVESCLLEHPAVQECAVVAISDPDGLLRPKAFVVVRAGQMASTDELQAHVKARLKPHMYPRAIAFVSALPRTTTGKIQRFKLRDL